MASDLISLSFSSRMQGGDKAVTNAMKLLLINLFIVLGATIWIALTPEPTGVAGMAHDSIAGMRKGGDGAARFSAIFVPALLMQYGTLSAILSLILVPLWRGPQGKNALAFIYTVMGLSVAVWLAIMLTYKSTFEGGDMPYLLGFPLPSALTAYAVWGVGLLLSTFYVFGFEKYVYTKEDRTGFETLLKDLEEQE